MTEGVPVPLETRSLPHPSCSGVSLVERRPFSLADSLRAGVHTLSVTRRCTPFSSFIQSVCPLPRTLITRTPSTSSVEVPSVSLLTSRKPSPPPRGGLPNHVHSLRPNTKPQKRGTGVVTLLQTPRPTPLLPSHIPHL